MEIVPGQPHTAAAVGCAADAVALWAAACGAPPGPVHGMHRDAAASRAARGGVADDHLCVRLRKDVHTRRFMCQRNDLKQVSPSLTPSLSLLLLKSNAHLREGGPPWHARSPRLCFRARPERRGSEEGEGCGQPPHTKGR
jgi:hypothetical protein